jgi:pimeloyl-ACP methyl ester carboxylesterase
MDYAALDDVSISMNAFYPRKNWSSTPPGASDHAVAVDDEISLSCRFFPVGDEAPTILFFYGNGETATDYNGIAPFYNQTGLNFFVSDYRGYGRSGGWPSFTGMLADSHLVLEYSTGMLESEGYSGRVYVMGRSMGRHSAFELAANCGDRLAGVIIESGRPILGNFVYGLPPEQGKDLEAAYLEKVSSITIPSLVIHGELDELAPVQQAIEMHHAFRSEDKRLLTVPGAGHNDLLHYGLNEYFAAIKEFTGA